MAMVQDVSMRVNGKLNQLKDHLIEFLHLPEDESDIIWANNITIFFKLIEKKR